MTDGPNRILQIPEADLTHTQKQVFDDLVAGARATADAVQDLDLFARSGGGHGNYRHVPE